MNNISDKKQNETKGKKQINKKESKTNKQETKQMHN